MKLSELIYDGVYAIGAKGNCDNCGSPQTLDHILGIYKGEYPTGHLFELITPFCCPGCHKVVDNYNIRVHMEVTKEYENIKAP